MNAKVVSNLFLLILMLTTFGYVTEGYFKMTKLMCTDTNDSLAILDNCRLKAVRRDVVEANIKYRIVRPLERLNLHVEMLRKYNTYEPFVINVTMDLCSYFNNPKKSYLNILFKLIEKYTNANHSCPYENIFMVNKFKPEHDKLILPLPSADYLIKFGIIKPPHLITRLQVWFTFREENVFKNAFNGKDHKKL